MESPVRVFVDADACPGLVRDIILRAAMSRKVSTIFVANKVLLLPSHPFISQVTVESGLDKADLYISEAAQRSDLVVTADVPLAHAVVRKGICAINPRGVVYTEENIGEHISVRDLMKDLRDAGEIGGGPKPFGDREKREFASCFDRSLTKLLKKFPLN